MTTQPSSFYFPAPRSQKFCSQCATEITYLTPPDDNRLRAVCRNCGAVHYQNPRNVVGVLPIFNDKILLCRRAISPQYDKWTLPAGFMELGETTAQGAMRETQEEAGAQIELGPLYTVIDVPHAEQVHFFYLAKVLSAELAPGPESLDARFFDPEDIPWDELAFRTVITTLEHYLDDKKEGVFDSPNKKPPIHHYDVPIPRRDF
ncbi:MAG: NUDIX hydrolase [Pusillimonas sp.]|jgi:ADP-ribose pyrophosphatase YjhB (NUDIX family)|nr:NUDIX hydrolase [Pusillimonas sp.]MBC44015.1 NUDIX hydrolase [Pusillimonas sp.]HCN72340.1 NUDIX hydrolase [Pusillimonas sp.]HCP78756.1 NUDIX hydrolase [Pusillimonas sp.]|tara:strand:- start:49751 stop:50362 length:612 start_codon:yes stop_codon:yes gene_type:complete